MRRRGVLDPILEAVVLVTACMVVVFVFALALVAFFGLVQAVTR
jgi:hypothetical protein